MASTVLLQPAPRVDEAVFIGVAWGGVALSGIFFIGRITARLTGLGRLMFDDLLVFCAWLMFLTSTIIWQINKDKLYQSLRAAAGLVYPIPPDLPENTEAYLKASVAILIFFYTSIWFIKFSFLFFFRTLGYQVRGQKGLWWTIATITFAAWIVSFGTIDYPCLMGSFEDVAIKCGAAGTEIPFLRRTLAYNMIIDVVTDALIITIPVNLLWRVRISMRQKLALMGIFSLTVFIMVFSIVRVALVLSWSNNPDESWLWMWSSIEQTVSIMVACLASFRLLFTKADSTEQLKKRKYFADWSSSGRDLVRTLKTKISFGAKASDHPYESFDLPTTPRSQARYTDKSFPPGDSIEHIMPAPQDIHVRNEFKATWNDSGRENERQPGSRNSSRI